MSSLQSITQIIFVSFSTVLGMFLFPQFYFLNLFHMNLCVCVLKHLSLFPSLVLQLAFN